VLSSLPNDLQIISIRTDVSGLANLPLASVLDLFTSLRKRDPTLVLRVEGANAATSASDVVTALTNDPLYFRRTDASIPTVRSATMTTTAPTHTAAPTSSTDIGLVVGVAIASTLVLCLVAALIVVLLFRRRKSSRELRAADRNEIELRNVPQGNPYYGAASPVSPGGGAESERPRFSTFFDANSMPIEESGHGTRVPN
jgi:hypothetical protein